ncbi:tetratricopeptide repeat protein [Tolypothrix sp. FACHB-123]|uniref:CHAT domain-containing protein n=1 Tax=Tolypothrix sp. FACHB-123 TaxID=2692868 RepID=UPI0016868F89|nr:tetratricopeptide repeat protein [Tolypothrix sp. FACHB-123]MBD2354903.1 tetratricopeptide repeat protein [Tolypothrix sp. FACHB-123]
MLRQTLLNLEKISKKLPINPAILTKATKSKLFQSQITSYTFPKHKPVKLLTWSIATAMTLGLLVSIPREVAGQTQPPLSAQQSAELAEAKRLSQQVVQLYRQGKYSEAIPLAERALAIREKLLGKEHPDVATSLNNLAVLYESQGNYAKAEPLHLRSLAIREKVLGKEHPNVAESLNNLALLYELQGSYAKAEPLYLRSLAIREKVLGKEHPDVATSLNNLAGLYSSQGNYAKAEPLYLRSLAIREKVLGKEHPDVAQSLNNLAELYSLQGNYAKAESLYLRSLAIWEKVLGKEHPNVATSLNNLAVLYKSQGNYAKAKSLYLRSLAIWEKVLGKEHPNVAQSLNNLALLYESQGNYAKAEPLYLRSLAIREKVLGKEHPDVATSLNNLATLYRVQGSYAKAEPLYLRSLAIREKVLGKEHPDVATSLNNLATLYRVQGSYAKAEPLYLATLAEGQQIKKILPQTSLILGKQATEAAIKQLNAPRILHLATHGFFLPDEEVKPPTNNFNQQLDQAPVLNVENPLLRSGLALAGFNNRQNKQTTDTDDGVFTALEVAGLNLRGTELVVLSACETGLGDVKIGGGVYGLRRALVIAGAQTQLLSLWQVADDGTKDLMVKYYEKLRGGKGRHEALREVQLELLNNPQYQHPYFWASFIPSGNWRGMN